MIGSGAAGYSDVASGAWYNSAVSTLTNAGILTGYEDGTFRPDAPITRAEFATIAARFYHAPGVRYGCFVYRQRRALTGWGISAPARPQAPSNLWPA